MNQYPEDFIVHNLPLVLLSGLESDRNIDIVNRDRSQAYLGNGGFRIRAELPPLHHPATESLRNILLSFDTSQAPWHSPPSNRSEAYYAFKILSIGRTFTFPPRKAPPISHSPRLRPTGTASPPSSTLHSTLSPLSPISSLYPDGIISPLWVTKHQHWLPSVLVCFYNLVSDVNTSSLEDNKIKNEVKNVRSLISSTNYKTKFVIVLVADGAMVQSDAEERLFNIRKGTNFDTKALYYLPFASSVVDLRDFARVLYATLYPTCIEYYRDLSKHARRKRNRNSIPQPTIPPPPGSAPVLALQGWNARYEFKLGVFAEFRQEMEAACRNYESAYDILLGLDLLEHTSVSKLRFSEARILGDVIAIRVIRCFLWSSQSAAAVKWWVKHRDNIQKLFSGQHQHAADSDWQTWRESWSRVAAELIERSTVFAFALAQLPANSVPPIQLPADRSVLTQEKLSPWENLHHEGYWLNHVTKYMEAQKTIDPSQPVHDNTSRQEISSVNGQVMDSSENDLRLTVSEQHASFGAVKDTGSDLLYRTVHKSINFFNQRQQRRMVEMLQFNSHRSEITTTDISTAASGLRSLWRQSSWRTQGWWSILEDVGAKLLKVALDIDDHELCLLLVWELLAFSNSTHSSLPTNIKGSVSAAAIVTTSLPRISPLFAFGVDVGHVGEQIIAQLCLRSFSNTLPFGLRIVELKIMFEGGINPVLITADEAEVSSSDGIMDINLREMALGAEKSSKRLSLTGSSYWGGHADLSINKRNRIYTFKLTPREAGLASVASIALSMSNGTQDLTLTTIEFEGHEAVWWEMRGGHPVARPFGMQRDVTTLDVQPKPPKIEINLPNLVSSYYTNETVELAIEINNQEVEEIIDVEIQVRLLSTVQNEAVMHWKHDETVLSTVDGTADNIHVLPSVPVAQISSCATHSLALNLSGLTDSIDHTLEFKVVYALQSEASAKLTKNMVVDVPVLRPFEISTTFSPRVHESEWSNFFTAPLPDPDTQPLGLTQKYLVKADLGSIAREHLTIKSLQLVTRRVLGGAVCSATVGRTSVIEASDDTSYSETPTAPDEIKSFYFDLNIHKLVLGDRQPVAVDFTMQVTWSRKDSTEENTTSLLIPKFMAPVAEPRVLLQTSKIEIFPGMYSLRYTLENPSMHFLTFSITMEGGEGLAFSGPKLKSVSLVPISRYDLEYRIYAQKSNDWANIRLQVLDAFFGQTLKIQPASEGVRLEKQGNIQIWLGS